jgi:BMFP domain-containing protein YqiC
MNNRNAWFEDLQKNISDLIARSPAADIERNVKGMMGQAFSKLDLVTREEFDIQTELLARTRLKIDALETQVKTLEARLTSLESPVKPL